MIAIKDYQGIVEQLKHMGIDDFSYVIFDPQVDELCPVKLKKDMCDEKYQIGYTKGIFDMFHLGHIEFLKKCKSRCHYLIVGVFTDELLKQNQLHKPFLSFEERLEMVKQCKYVDRVISVDKNYSDELVVWKELRYSCLFLDKHREENTDFIWLKRKLYSLGVEIESISYTESEAYMKLKELVDNECDIGVTYAEKNK